VRLFQEVDMFRYFFESLLRIEDLPGTVIVMLPLAYSVGMIINGDLENRLPNIINITLPNIPSDLLVIEFSARGILVSGKSACKSGDGKASYVIQAIDKKVKGYVFIDTELVVKAKRLGYRIKELSVHHLSRKSGKSFVEARFAIPRWSLVRDLLYELYLLYKEVYFGIRER